MKAYQLKKTGAPEVLKMVEIDEPSPRPNQVKVKIETIGINYAEVLSRKGQYGWAPKKPYIPGMEAYGEIVEIGSEVVNKHIGDKVIIGQQYGNYSEYTCVESHLCFPAIEGFTPEENAAYLISFITAWVSLKKLGRVEKGERVLIHAAAGGLGTAAVQVAKALGCHVFGTASQKRKLDLIKELGADRAINYKMEDFYDVIMKEGGKVDFVLEIVGGNVFKKSLKLLNPFGRIAVIGFASINFKKWNPITWWRTWRDAPKVKLMSMAVRSQSISASHIGYLTGNKEITSKIWVELKEFVETNNLRPVVGKVFSFEELPNAHGYMESRNSIGKIVVRVPSE